MKRTNKAKSKKQTVLVAKAAPIPQLPQPTSFEVPTGAIVQIQQQAVDELTNYEFLEVMGKGAFGRVYKARTFQSPELVAVKQILEDETMMNRETAILNQIKNHPNIINLRHHFYTTRRALTNLEMEQSQLLQQQNQQEFLQHVASISAGPNKKYLNLVTDFMPLTLSKWNLSGRESFMNGCCDPVRVLFVKQLMYQFLSAIQHVHLKGIAHRDIKPDNILINAEQNCKPEQRLKLCDFGSAKALPHHNYPNVKDKEQQRGSVTYISTRYYRAPELLYGNQYYGIEIDMWAAGCVLAEMFTKPQIKRRPMQNGGFSEQKSYTLFRGDSNIHQLALILQLKGPPTKVQLAQINPVFKQQQLPDVKPAEIRSRLEEGVPSEAIDLIERLLDFVPSSRITAEQALKHKFFEEITQERASTSNATSASSRKRLRSEVSADTSVQKTEPAANAKKIETAAGGGRRVRQKK